MKYGQLQIGAKKFLKQMELKMLKFFHMALIQYGDQRKEN
jgi:hypothetical protein